MEATVGALVLGALIEGSAAARTEGVRTNNSVTARAVGSESANPEGESNKLRQSDRIPRLALQRVGRDKRGCIVD